MYAQLAPMVVYLKLALAGLIMVLEWWASEIGSVFPSIPPTSCVCYKHALNAYQQILSNYT
jgi:hypothetical protein